MSAASAVFIVGAGRVGRALATAFTDGGVTVTGVHGRSAAAGVTSTGAIPRAALDTDAILVAVPDGALDDVLREVASLASRHAPARLPVVLVTSGGARPDIQDLTQAGLELGRLHPLLPFTGCVEQDVGALRTTWFGVGGSARAREVATSLAQTVSGGAREIAEGTEALYHAAAVMASNFPVVLANAAMQLFQHCGVDPQAAGRMATRLVAAAGRNLELGAPEEVLTGPAVRGDAKTLAAHMDAIESVIVAARRSSEGVRRTTGLSEPDAGGPPLDPALLDAYRALSRLALEVARRRGISEEELAAALSALAGVPVAPR